MPAKKQRVFESGLIVKVTPEGKLELEGDEIRGEQAIAAAVAKAKATTASVPIILEASQNPGKVLVTIVDNEC